MSRMLRLEKAESQLRILEAQFLADLTAALRECAAGKWGMFGQNDHLAAEMPLLKSAYTDTAEDFLEPSTNYAAIAEANGGGIGYALWILNQKSGVMLLWFASFGGLAGRRTAVLNRILRSTAIRTGTRQTCTLWSLSRLLIGA